MTILLLKVSKGRLPEDEKSAIKKYQQSQVKLKILIRT